jgi:hypothetical protein
VKWAMGDDCQPGYVLDDDGICKRQPVCGQPSPGVMNKGKVGCIVGSPSPGTPAANVATSNSWKEWQLPVLIGAGALVVVFLIGRRS